MKRFSLLYCGAVAAVLVCTAPTSSRADEYDKKTVMTITQPTEVPGIILEPGTYVVKLLNSSSNRHIAEIMNERMDHLYALTFTVAAARVERAEKPILTFYESRNGRPQALRKWFWPGETDGQEFVYPKDQAARIAAATDEKVAEGNLPTVAESGQALIPDNAKGLALESNESSTETVAPVTARAVEPEPAPAPPAETVAQAAPVPAPAAEPEAPAPPVTVIAQNTPPAPVRTVETPREPAPSDSPAENLPQTASRFPLVGAIGVVSLALALSLAAVRRRAFL